MRFSATHLVDTRVRLRELSSRGKVNAPIDHIFGPKIKLTTILSVVVRQ